MPGVFIAEPGHHPPVSAPNEDSVRPEHNWSALAQTIAKFRGETAEGVTGGTRCATSTAARVLPQLRALMGAGSSGFPFTSHAIQCGTTDVSIHRVRGGPRRRRARGARGRRPRTGGRVRVRHAESRTWVKIGQRPATQCNQPLREPMGGRAGSPVRASARAALFSMFAVSPAAARPPAPRAVWCAVSGARCTQVSSLRSRFCCSLLEP